VVGRPCNFGGLLPAAYALTNVLKVKGARIERLEKENTELKNNVENLSQQIVQLTETNRLTSVNLYITIIFK
jgi:cell division protein FtsB